MSPPHWALFRTGLSYPGKKLYQWLLFKWEVVLLALLPFAWMLSVVQERWGLTLGLILKFLCMGFTHDLPILNMAWPFWYVHTDLTYHGLFFSPLNNFLIFSNSTWVLHSTKISSAKVYQEFLWLPALDSVWLPMAPPDPHTQHPSVWLTRFSPLTGSRFDSSPGAYNFPNSDVLLTSWILCFHIWEKGDDAYGYLHSSERQGKAAFPIL